MSGLLEDRTGVKARTPMPTHDVTSATRSLAVTNETVSFDDGNTGTTQQIKLLYDGILAENLDRIGAYGDTSISWTTGTVLTTEVPWRFKNTEGKDTETDRIASLSNGEYMVDYENGYILGLSATDTATSTDTISYSVRTLASTIVGGGGDASAANQTSQIALATTLDSNIADILTGTETFVVDTTSIEAKTPELGSTTMANSTPVTMATDDTVATDLTAIKTGVEIMDDWDNAASDGASVTGDVAHDAVDAGEPVKTGGYAVSSQRAAVAAADRVDSALSLYGETIQRSHTYGSQSDRSEEIDPLDEHYVEEELVDTTDLGSATTYYPSATGRAMGNFNNVSVHFALSGGVTYTMEAKIDDSTDWIDITPAGFELATNATGAASFVDTSGIVDWDDLHVRTIRIKSVTADATNGVQYHWKLTSL